MDELEQHESPITSELPEVRIHLDPASVLEEPPEPEDDCEKPPDYDSLTRAHNDLPQTSGSGFITEAPPTYQQLFGVKRSSQRRPHTRPRNRENHRLRTTTSSSQSQSQSQSQSWAAQLQERYPKLSKFLVRLTAVCVIACFLALSSAMIILGSLNIDRCASLSVPLYLIVAGLLMVAELMFHGIIWLVMKHSENESTFRALRICDCIAFVLLIWLLIGSNWVFKLSIAGSSGCDSPRLPIDDIIQLNTTIITDGSGGTQFIVVTETPDSTPTCMDCPSGVYRFTVTVILLQYIGALLIVIGCCSRIFRK